MRRWSVVATGLSLLALGSLMVAASSSAQTEFTPTISGNAVVGETLVAHAPGNSQNYRWQRCNPATSDCTGGTRTDSNYGDIDGATAKRYTLAPGDAGFFVRVLVKDTSLGTKWFPSDPVGPVAGPPPGSLLAGAMQLGILPQHGISVLAQPSGGVVKLKQPGQKKFSEMIGIQLIPVGTVINARNGAVQMIAAVGEFANSNPDSPMEFSGDLQREFSGDVQRDDDFAAAARRRRPGGAGLFKIKQSDEKNAPAIAKLLGNLRCGGGGEKGKKSAAASAAAGPIAKAAARRRGLWGRGSGRYATRGRGGTGSVVGTTWFTKDTCKGTFWKVKEGVGISVDPKGKKKDVFLEPGETYFAER